MNIVSHTFVSGSGSLSRGPEQGALQDGTSAGTEPVGPSSNVKCSAQSQDDVLALLRAATALTELACPLCNQSFNLKKSLLRHLKSAVRHYLGTGFQCKICGQKFARQDILVRHEEHKHGSKSDLVRCDICGLQVRPRSMKGHKETRSCREAAQQQQAPSVVEDVDIDNDDLEKVLAKFPNYLPMSKTLRDILDCVLLNGWLFAVIQPWGRGHISMEQWLLRIPVAQTTDIRLLKSLVFRSLQTATTYADAEWDGGLFDSIILLAMSITFIDGWALTPAHQEVILRLAYAQICKRPVSRQDFINRPLCDAFSHVVVNAVKQGERGKCEAIMLRGIQMLRSSTFDYLTMITSGFTRPATQSAINHFANTLTAAEFAATYGQEMVRIGEIAASVHVA